MKSQPDILSLVSFGVEKVFSKFLQLETSQFSSPTNSAKLLQVNVLCNDITLDVSHPETSKDLSESHLSKVSFKLTTFGILIFAIFNVSSFASKENKWSNEVTFVKF